VKRIGFGRRWVLLVALLVTQAAMAAGEASPQQPGFVASTPITVGERITFRSEVLSTTVSMNLALPASFAHSSAEHTYPVIFINGEHGNRFFSTLAGIVKHLGDRERIPESIVVSLNDMGDIPEIFTNGMWSRETLGGSGDPRKSLQHLEREVIPYLERRYRANDYRMIIGVSGSSLFPIYTFTQAPTLFDSHVLIAAADMMGMGYEAGKTFRDAFEAAFLESPKRKAKLYVGVADSDVEKRPDYRENLDDLAKRLGRFKKLDVRAEVVANADHYEVFIKSMLSAFDQNFPMGRWSSRYREIVAQPGDALANIDRYYEELSREVGFRVLPRADRWNSVNCLRFMIRHLIQEGRAKEAVAVAQRRVQYRPSYPPAYEGLAEALEANGEITAAVEAQKKANELAKAKAEGEAEAERKKERLRSLLQQLPS